MNEKCYISTLHSDAPIDRLNPKVIAKITLCGVFTVEICEGTNWNPPTPEQIKNLKEMLNIDVELIGKTDES